VFKTRKRFGQHFLQDEHIIAQILAAFHPDMSEHIVEIGPGRGALTFPLLIQNSEFDAVELDQDLIPYLKTESKRFGNLNLHEADALSFDFADLKKDERKLRIIGNLPYNISTPLIFHLLTFTPYIADMLFMLQKEVAKRLAASPRCKDYGRLTVMVQYHCQVNCLFDVPSTAFYPHPKVTSTIVQLIPYQPLPYVAKNAAVFSAVVNQAFNQRRKTLRNSLSALFTEEDWARTTISSQLRAEDLSVGDFVALSNLIAENPL
jgi:16S rRNA (adenine1518-N6/adenine1519-N6)-dimethyltransferase